MIRILSLLFLTLVPALAHAEWHEASGKHFLVYSQGTVEELQGFVDKLERFDSAVRYLRRLPDPAISSSSRLTIFLVDSQSTISRLGGAGVAGFYIPRATGSVAFAPRDMFSNRDSLSTQAILLHEYTHHLMFNLFPNASYPLWLSEGFAEFHATARFEESGSIIFGAYPMYRQYTMSKSVMPASRMLTSRTEKLDGKEIASLYGRGWLLTHYLTLGGKRDNQLEAYILALNSGKSEAEAAQAFGNLSKLDRELDFYAFGTIPGRRVAATAITPAPVMVRTLSPGEAATMDVRIRSQRGVDRKTAPAVYAAAKTAAAPFPNDAAAQRALAEAAYDAGDFVGAESAADRALAADPKMVEALCYKANARMARAIAAKDTSPATWSAIRKIIGAANRIDPDDPEPLMLYYRSFADAGQPVPALAKNGLKRAYALAPEDKALRLDTARVFLDDSDGETARKLLAPLAFNPHGKIGAAAKALALLDSGDVDGARQALDSHEDTEKPDAGNGDPKRDLKGK